MSANPRIGMSPPPWRAQVALRTAHATRDDPWAARAWSLAELEDLLSATARFDPDTGAPVGRLLSAVLTDLNTGLAAGAPTIPRDALVRAAQHAAQPLAEVVAAPRTRLQRQHTMERPERVRTLDARSMAWLARQPGIDARSKLGASRKLLAVVREQSAEVPANRFVRRLAAELGAYLETVFAHLDPGAPLDAEACDLRSILALCRLDSPGGVLAEVCPAVAPVPDNVLLGDRRYARLWRAWEQLRALDDATEARWCDAESWLAAGVAWAVVARLAAHVGAQLEERWVTFDVHHPGPGSEGARVHLRTPFGLRSVVVRTERERVTIEEVCWTGVGRMQRRPGRTWTFACAFDSAAPVVAGEGHAAEIVEDAERLGFAASRVGLQALAEQVVGALDLPGPLRDATSPAIAPAPTVAWPFAGLDLAGPRALVSDGVEAHQGARLLARETLCDAHPTWVVGDAAARWAPSEAERVWGAVDLWRAAVSPGLGAAEGPALSALAGLLQAELGDGRTGARVAVAMPDGLDELSLAALRTSLSGAFDRAPLWVWRSVAAAVGWRAEGPCPIARGEALVVIDLGMPRFGGAVLVARDDGDPDRWFWERPLATPARQWEAQHDATAALAASLQADDPGLSTRSAERTAASCDGDLVLVEDEALLLSLNATEAAQRVARRAVQWANDYALRREGLERARRAANGGAVHVLVVGAPAGDETALVVADALRGEVAWCRSTVHVPRHPGGVVARGAAVAVRRLDARLPVWVDILPRLCLEVTLKGGRRSIEIFPRKAVRAGEDVPYRVSERIQIPAGVPALRLPLLRDDDDHGHTAVDIDARIEDPSFPLKREVEVRIDVRFSRVDDRFHVTLRPLQEAPFSALEVVWSRHDEGDARGEIVDAAPAWPEVVSFEALPDECFKRFDGAVAALKLGAGGLESKRLKPRLSAARNDTSKRDALVADLLAVVESLGALDAAAIRLFAPGRRVGDAPKPLRARVDEAASLLEDLVMKAPCADERSTELRRAGEKVVAAAARAMSRLRGAATERFVTSVLDAANGPLAAQRWHLLGRVLADGRPPARDRVLVTLDRAFQSPTGPTHEQLWALATALWADEGFVTAAAPHLDAWRQGIERVLDAIEAGGTRSNALDECAAVLLGLLRLRGTPPGDALSAQHAPVRALGDRIAKLDGRLAQRGRPRLGVTGGRALADVTASALRGEAVARIEMIEE